MTDKLRFTRAQIRTAAMVAKDEGVSIELRADGSMSIVPVIPANHNQEMVVKKDIIRL